MEEDDDLPAFLKQAKKKEKEDKQKQAELDKKTASARMTTAHTNEVADLNDALKHLQDLLLDPMIQKDKQTWMHIKKRYDELRSTGESVSEGKAITEEEFDEAAGKKDACYHKVKARYKVWPSAYASGALVQCRKKGAANWGNKSD
jgi:predicted nuclease with TOPRIM domain